ncbi:hypothetical protein ABFX02_07G016200 [Erythranthe guttata]
MAAAAAPQKDITFDECWSILQEEAINKMVNIFEAEEQPNDKIFDSEEYMRFYTAVYHVCCSYSPDNWNQKLYDQYKKTFEDYISSKVLPSLREKSDENLLREFSRRWKNHKTMTKWLSMFLYYLSRYYIPSKRLPSLAESSHSIFYNLVYKEMHEQVHHITMSMIDRERNGEHIDQAMVSEVIKICEEMGSGNASKHDANNIDEALVLLGEATYSFTGLRLEGNA